MLGHKMILPRGVHSINCYSLIRIVCCLSLFGNVTCNQTVEVYEGLPPGSAILKLKQKAGIAYSLYEDSSTADGSSLFYIDSNGILTSKVTLDYEDERGNVFDLLVISREITKADGGFGSLVRVRILDRNDNTPKFPKDLYTSTIPENCRTGAYVTGLESVYASDLDSDENSVKMYSIVAGNEEEKFAVDFRVLSGIKFLLLKTKAPIDREETPYFVLTVQVADGGYPSLKSTTQVRVNVLDENDHAPIFSPPTYSVSVSENAEVGTSVLQVKAFDADSGTNAEIYYYFKPEHDFFTIDAHTGTVETACKLNFQKGNSIDLWVYAVDRGRVPRRTKSLLQIRLEDIESYPPPSLGIVSSKFRPLAFQQHAYSVRIREDFPVGGAIVRVEAQQGSGVQPQNKPWLYVIHTQPTIVQTIFHINPRSGIITLREPLDYETRTSFSFIVKAQDEQSKDLYDSQTQVKVVIEDINENYFAPIFNHSSSVVSISENVPKNFVVSKLSAYDKDEGIGRKVSFAISGGSGLGKFNIDQNNGKIRPLVRFSSEMGSQFDLHVRASDNSKQPLYSNAFLLIRLRNSQQKRPLFFNTKQVITIRENSLRGTFVALVRATVRARTQREQYGLEYYISSGNEAGRFSLNSSSGIISIASSVDRETQDLYILDIIASINTADPPMSSLSQVVVMITDENDNTPSFDAEEFKVNLTENMGPVSNLLCLAASDPDSGENGNITYTILSSTGPFSIDPALGILSVRESLNFEEQRLHKVVVQAADQGTPRHKTLANVDIHVQDANDPPMFSQDHYTVSVSENADFEGTVVDFDVSDQDRDKNGMFACSMENMDLETMDTFTVRKTPKGCALVLTGYLEWSSVNRYSLSVRATDYAEAGQQMSGVASVTIKVQDTNNHDPEFLQSSYWVSLPNDAGVGASVLTVKARDLDEGSNGDIRYKLSSDICEIDPITGTVTLRQGLGSVRNKKYEFSVRATDQGSPNRQTAVMAYVSVHELSYVPPHFLKPVYRALVAESVKSGTMLLTVHAQKSIGLGGSIEYSIVGGDPRTQFSVSARSGVFTLRKQLDYEKAKQHVVVVRAVQNGLSRDKPSLPTEIKVIVDVMDVNDNRPRFAHPVDPLVTSINELQPAGAIVTVVRAFDKDTGNHSSITYGLDDDDFQIDPFLGTITTTKKLFQSMAASHTFDVTATDSTPPYRKAKAKVVVMVNTAIPPLEFQNMDFAKFVPENISIGKSLVRFVPRHSRTTLKYWIAKGDYGNHWCIDTTAKVRLNKRLDHESRASYHLNINVNDGRKTFPGPTVLFNIDDINDNVPQFASSNYKFYIAEDVGIGQTVGLVTAVDRDDSTNSKLKYSIVGEEDVQSRGKFEINPSSGLLTTKQTLDREDMPQHVILVRVEDKGKPPLSSIARVTVVVSDVNDNDPAFASQKFRAWVRVDAKVGSRIFAVVASDVDWGENGILRYSIVQGNAKKIIEVDPVEGSISLARSLTSLEPIEFGIMARDLGQPSRNTTVDVIIEIQPVGGPPRFLSPNTAHVKENETAVVKVIRIVAASVDPLIKYKILSGNEGKSFHLEPYTGLINTTRPLDYETVTHYDLVVMAIDSSNRMNYAKVVVQVDNINDNEPHFVGAHGAVIEGQVLVDAIAGSHVMWLKIDDRDVNDVITYKILDNRAAEYFHINSEGELKISKSLTGLQSPYEFRIEASDNGIPPKSAFSSVRIVLLKYQTQQKELEINVPEDVKKSDLIMQVKDSAGIQNPRFLIISPVGTPFSINKTGAIGILRPLDYETTKNYTIIVQVENSENLKEYTNIDVVIKIIDVNDNSPVFTMNQTQGLYLAKVNRNPVRGTLVYRLTASDRDSTGLMRYSLREDNALFEVEAESGNVKTRGQQLLMATFYNITVGVSDGGVPSLHAYAVLHVQVGEYPPEFNQENYVFTVKENTQKGFTIGDIKARSFSGASFSYTVVNGNSDKRFILDRNTGRLALSDPLDYERDSNVYALRIRAEEVGIIPKLSSEVNVKILLKDINDNPPEFSRQRYRYTLPESAPVGTTVLSVSATDSDAGINGQLRYHVDDQHFTVNPYTGEITTVKPLDYETSRSHIFVVVAKDGGIPVLTGTARVEVTLQNVNDNPPRFLQSMYNEYVNEDAGRGELVTTVQANDMDQDPVSYSIISGDNTSNFVMDNHTGVVRLVSHRKPNLIGPYYILNISASDGLHVSQAMLLVAILDINNHKPVFRDCHTYRPVIAENRPRGSTVIQVSAEDDDMGDNGRISYHIERSTADTPHFEIDSNSGLVTTAESFDREKKRSYQIRITGKDGGQSRQEGERLMGFCQVEIMIDDVNDNSPIFGNERYETSVKEDLEIGQMVLQVSATDKDAGINALITYSFENLNEQFSISNETGVITTKRSLASSAYAFSVIARDNGEPARQSKAYVTISVYKVGKNPPKFEKEVYVAHVREDLSPWKIVLRVTATSPDPNKMMIFYTIENYPQPFTIATATGVLRTTRPLDYEVMSNYTVHIRAQDTQDPPLVSFARVEIYVEDVNDSPPEFPVSKYEGHVAENSPIGTSVIEVEANDPDKGQNGLVSYSFNQKESYDDFALDNATGLITTRKVFDRERSGRYTLIVEARDHGKVSKKSSCLVAIIINDQNDNAPVFERSMYNISVFEDVALGTRILTVSATDEDIGNNAIVNYYITSGNQGAAFAINKGLGQIFVASSLDRETQATYHLKIRALDGRNSGTAVVNIRIKDTNDNNPVFSNNTYYAKVYENQPNGSYVTTLYATDKDLGRGGMVLYSISGQGKEAFRIDPKTGVLTTIKPLDREAKSRYDFLAFATDNPDSDTGSRRTGSCDVVIWIRDINDNAPRFPDDSYEGGVRENKSPGALVMVLSAVDDDDPNENGNAIMSYELIDDSNGTFRIERDTGLIRTRVRLDREQTDEYLLVVNATDRGTPALWGQVEVKVKVTDANDHVPRFEEREFFVSVFENATIDSSVTLLNATDEDIGVNAKLRYSITQGAWDDVGNSGSTFHVLEDTGEIRVTRSLDFETKKDYKLKVMVRDSGTPSNFDIAEVTISVQDSNDNPPVFSPYSYAGQVKENKKPEILLLQVSASDSDTGANKEFKFSIQEGDPQGHFRIDADSGNLYVHRVLDRETQPSYLLTVRATNIAVMPALYGEASVQVRVIDANDNGPIFHPSVFYFSVKENTARSQSIGRISVDDPDLDPPNGGPFSFQIANGNEEGLFWVNNITGEFFTRATFDRERRAQYLLEIKAFDSGDPQQESTTKVYVRILDDNDNQHSSGTLSLVLNSYQGKFPGGRVGKVYVIDEDINDRRMYEVLTNSSAYFSVERTTGMIISRSNPPKGDHSFTVKVSDTNSSFSEVICTVFIKVKEVTAEAIQKSIALRLGNVSREFFVTTVQPRFKESIARILQTSEDNVDLFSVQKAQKTLKAIDVRFAAHGSPYYAPERMRAILKNSWDVVSKAMKIFGVDVLLIGVDECLNESCAPRGCTNVLRANGDVEVISAKKTVFASIIAEVKAECEDCNEQEKVKQTCSTQLCLNGGTCVDTPDGYVCRCFPGFNGPNCELTTRSFKHNDWVWLPPPQQCSSASLSLEFATKEANGLLLYGGPTSPVRNGDVHDFITVELAGGKILVLVSLGDRDNIVRVSVTSGITLNDGEWHHVEVSWNGTLVRVTVDKCRGATLRKGRGARVMEDRSSCSSAARLKNDTFKMLNLNGPLQIGGVWTKNLLYPKLSNTNYKGCIRNVLSQGKYYDLKTPSHLKGTKEGCPVMDQHCRRHDCDPRATCVPSWNGHSCSCPFGLTGRTCGQKTLPRSYDDGSFTQYVFHLHKFKYDWRETKIRMQIRTRDPDGGVLMFNAGSQEGRYSLLEVVPLNIDGEGERELIVTYTLGSANGERCPMLQVTGVNVGDGQWHNVSVVRERSIVTLSVDSGSDGYSVTKRLGEEHALFELDPTRTFIGGLQSPILSHKCRDTNKDFVGCVSGVRFNGYPLNNYNGSSVVGYARSIGVSEGCIATPVCKSNSCVASEWCRDVWRKFVCLPRLCTSKPCKNGGRCLEGVDSNGNGKFRCQCPGGFEGALCEVKSSVVVATIPNDKFERGLIIGLSVLVVTLVLSACISIVYIRCSRAGKQRESQEEQHFQPDNVANYRIEGGGEADLEEEDHLRDILKSFETADFTPCQSRFKLSGSNSDVNGPVVVMAPIKREGDVRKGNGIPGLNYAKKPVKPETQDTDSSFSQGGSDQEPPDSSSSPSAVSTPERRRRVRSSSKGELCERQTPEGGEGVIDISPTRKLTEIFGLNEQEQVGMRSPPEGFSSPEKFSSLNKRERGNGASLQRPEKSQDCNNCEQIGAHCYLPSEMESLPKNSFGLENPLSRPISDICCKLNGKADLPAVQRRSLSPKKSARCGYPRGVPPQAGTFLPDDAMQRFYFEGSGSPTISLSTLGDNSTESETDESYEYMNHMGEKFNRLARICGVQPSVKFSPHDEFIGE